MTGDSNLFEVIAGFNTRTKVLALVAIIIDAAQFGVIPFLPKEHRIFGLIVCAVVLVVLLVGIFRMELSETRTKAKNGGGETQDHEGPNLAAKVERLKAKLVEKRFLPDLIIGIPRGGLVVAALLSRQFGDDRIVPIISLWPDKEFSNPFNTLQLQRQNFDIQPPGKINVLIVDDICRSGTTLREARDFVEKFLNPEDFTIQTAAISFYKRPYSRRMQPTFFVETPEQEIRDFKGVLEPDLQLPE